MRRALLALTAVAVLGVAGCAAHAATSAGSAPTSRATTSPSATVPAPASVTTPPPAVPIAPATTFSGFGETTVSITKPAGTTTVIATISGGTPGRHFGVRALDGSKQYLVEAEGVYQGSVLLDGDGNNTTQLHVFARKSPWSITLSDPRTAPTVNTGTNGTGDTVFTYQGSGGLASVTGGATGTPFQIRAYGGGRLNGGLVVATGPYNGQVVWPAGVALISVRATGPWTISFG